MFDITPTTFILDMNGHGWREEMNNFLTFFKEHSKNSSDQTAGLSTLLTSPQKVSKLMGSPSKKTLTKYSSPKMSETMNSGMNIWLLKPTEYNCGRGINLFNKLPSLDFYLKCLQKGSDQQKGSTLLIDKARGAPVNVVKSQRFVIQKYLEKPLLINNRKFDIRVWVLIDHEMNLYCFKEKYIRLSSEPFTLDEDKITDKFVHLTNNAIQKHGKHYSQHESGNIISFNDLKVEFCNKIFIRRYKYMRTLKTITYQFLNGLIFSIELHQNCRS